jgi:7-cyano-7-deazaguanine reductase
MQSGVGVRLLLPEMFDREPIHELDGLSLDRLDIECTRYTPGAGPAARRSTSSR